jgi:hypothetical protein
LVPSPDSRADRRPAAIGQRLLPLVALQAKQVFAHILAALEAKQV